MKKQVIIGLILCAYLLRVVSAYEQGFNETTTSQIQIKQLKYEPYPVSPGEYFDVWVEVTSLGGNPSEDIVFTLNPEYPFSLDANEEAVRNIGRGSKQAVLHYKVRVSDDAVEGTNELKLSYNVFGINYEHVFDIQVSDVQTDFDLVIQESTGTDVSIAIANIGKNTANSLIVRIPEQANYKVSGTNGQIVGNLDSGDYTLASFAIAQVGRKTETQDLQVQLDYTDSIGKRRSIIKNVPFASASPVGYNLTKGQRTGNFQRTTTQTTSIFKTVWFWAIIVALGAVYWYHKKHPGKIKSYFSKEHTKTRKSTHDAPDWVSAERTKKK